MALAVSGAASDLAQTSSQPPELAQRPWRVQIRVVLAGGDASAGRRCRLMPVGPTGMLDRDKTLASDAW